MMRSNKTEDVLSQGDRTPRGRRAGGTVPAPSTSSSNDGLPTGSGVSPAGEMAITQSAKGELTIALTRCCTERGRETRSKSRRRENVPVAGGREQGGISPSPSMASVASAANTEDVINIDEDEEALSETSVGSGTGKGTKRKREQEQGRGPGRPPVTGEGIAIREIQMKQKKIAELEDLERRIRELQNNPVIYQTRSLEELNEELREEFKGHKSATTVELSAVAAEEINKILKLGEVSKNLKGGLVRELRRASLVVRSAADQLALRALSQKTGTIDAEIEALREQNKSLREELARIRSEAKTMKEETGMLREQIGSMRGELRRAQPPLLPIPGKVVGGGREPSTPPRVTRRRTEGRREPSTSPEKRTEGRREPSTSPGRRRRKRVQCIVDSDEEMEVEGPLEDRGHQHQHQPQGERRDETPPPVVRRPPIKGVSKRLEGKGVSGLPEGIQEDLDLLTKKILELVDLRERLQRTGNIPSTTKERGKEKTQKKDANLAATTPANAWSKVVGRKASKKEKGGGGKGPDPVRTGTPAPKRTTQVRTPDKKKRVRKRVPNTQAIILRGPPGEYSKLMKIAREKINIKEIGIEGIRVRKTLTGYLILEIPNKDGGAEKADALLVKLRRALSGLEGVRVERPIKKAEIRIRGFDESVSTEDVVEAISEKTSCYSWDITVGQIRAPPRGMCSAWVKCPVGAAVALAKEGRLKLGWANASVELLQDRPMLCYKCMEPGHIGVACKSGKDRSSLCFRCGQTGHKAKGCAEPVKCPICADQGRPDNHRVGGRACRPTPRKKDGGKAPPQGRQQQQPRPEKAGTTSTVDQEQVTIVSMDTEEEAANVEAQPVEPTPDSPSPNLEWGEKGVTEKWPEEKEEEERGGKRRCIKKYDDELPDEEGDPMGDRPLNEEWLDLYSQTITVEETDAFTGITSKRFIVRNSQEGKALVEERTRKGLNPRSGRVIDSEHQRVREQQPV